MRFRNWTRQRWVYPLTVFVIMLAAYGLQIHRLGFYWDDWQALYLSRFGTSQALWDFFLADRPISSWTFIVTLPVLGLRPLAWQLFTLSMRWLAVMGVVFGLTQVWQTQRPLFRWVGLLLAVYPGFSQQAVSVAYSQHFMTYAVCTWSLAAMVYALRHKSHYWVFTMLGVFGSLLHMLTMEYFVGLEALRPLLLGFLLWNEGFRLGEFWRKLFGYWVPYLLTLVGFFIYRFVILPGMMVVPDQNAPLLLQQLSTEPVQALLRLLQLTLQDSLHALIYVWTNILSPLSLQLNAKIQWFSWLVGLACTLGLVWLIKRQAEPVNEVKNAAVSRRQIVLTGLVGILAGGLPVWISNRQALVGAWSDRFTLGPMLGAVLVLTTVVYWLTGSPKRRIWVLAILTGLGVSAHIITANRYARQWQVQKDYYWQVAWRMPDVKDGTAILGPEIPFSYNSGISLGFGYNLLFDPYPKSTDVPVWFIEALRYRGSQVMADFKPDLPIAYKELRNISFVSTTNQGLGVNYNNARGCVRVMDPVYRFAPALSNDPIKKGELELYAISHPQQIVREQSDNQQVMRTIFGNPPQNTWCEIYEKADLARQFQDWPEVLRLYDAAQQQGLKTSYGPEWLPFLEAFVQSGDLNKAIEISGEMQSLTGGMEPLLCDTWQRLDALLPAGAEKESIYAWEQAHSCTEVLDPLLAPETAP